ncbi:MAG: putative integral membrane protein linked to a cation pump [Candidatus Accumulibacter adjunctus]|uniref:Integral membrane protein linked to a cation pump n=1 Tax=Candidatus Accumulibacter adjunctus TaxID=1454001 RepID=A0A011NVU5_9PROT|nr:MAG: putative integral membrane protein linked to a cation pump [Candidatus Accumulibacter adjunctus]
MSKPVNSPVTPWYRQPWPWLLMLGPLVVVVAGLATAYLAVVSDDGLVVDDYYKEGLGINQRTARDQRAADLGIAAELVLSSSGERIRVLLQAGEDVRMPDRLSLRIAHPTRPGLDQNLLLRGEGGRVYGAPLRRVQEGRWHVVLEDERQEWRLAGDWAARPETVMQLQAARPATAPARVN